jgi:thiol-disulfide isomerase/thioredoxin
MYYEFTDENFTWDIHAAMRKKGLFHTYKMEIAKKQLSDSNLEFYGSAYIHSSASQNKYEKELITLFEEFKSEFPNNKYSPYTEPLITNIIDFHNKAKQEFGEETRFVTNYENIRSLNECLQNFKGKKVYIDIWATWCVSCIKEFKYSQELKNLLKLKNIELLSISLDKDEADKQWKDMIKYYNLAGYHIRVNKELYADLDTRLDLSFVPRYILVDENGTIIEKYASFPSQLKELEKQLSTH